MSAVTTALLMLSAAGPARCADRRSRRVPLGRVGHGRAFPWSPGRRRRTSRQYDRWYNTGTLAVTAGRYLTPHLKIEAEGVLDRRGRALRDTPRSSPGYGARPVSSDQFVGINERVRRSRLAVLRKPMGASRLCRRARRSISIASDDRRGRSRSTAATREFRATRSRSRPRRREISAPRGGRAASVGAGAKVYMTPHAFFRTDTRIAVGPAVDMWRCASASGWIFEARSGTRKARRHETKHRSAEGERYARDHDGNRRASRW